MTYSFYRSMDNINKRFTARESGDFIGAEMVVAFWETKPEIVKKLLPPPLKPVKYPLANVFIGDFPKTNWGLPYRESALFLRSQFNNVPGNYCLAMHLEGPGADMGMVSGRESYGFPKKGAKVVFKLNGDKFEGWSERHGVRNLHLKARLNGKANTPDMEKILAETAAASGDAIAYNFKYFREPGERMNFDYKPVLTSSITIYRPEVQILGEVEITLDSSIHDPWAEIEVVRPLGALYLKGTNSMTTGKIEAEVDPLEFLPYSFIKMDWF
ncbi:MAG: acetoacetate decarboxylase family protein [Candidatus Thorarchaeota archaeon]